MDAQQNMDFETTNNEWGDIDDITLAQISDEIECDYLFGELSLGQTLSVYDTGNFDLVQVPLTIDNVLDELEKQFGDGEMEYGQSPSNNDTAAVDDKIRTKNDRYEFVDDGKVKELIASTESKNTRKNTKWAVSTFEDWRLTRIQSTGGHIPELLEFGIADINKWLSKFMIETRRKDGNVYPPRTLYMLAVGILRHLRESGIHLNFLDENNSAFYDFRKALSARMAELTNEGVGTTPKQAEPISSETESQLWEKGILGNNCAKSLLNTVFFYNCKFFGLRAVDEHRQLSVAQIHLSSDQNGMFIHFTGRANKTYKGGLNQRHIGTKDIKHHLQNPALYDMYKEYMDSIPPGDAFYRRPLANRGENGELRFSSQPLGLNKLSCIVKNMCTEAGISGFFTNHSGKRTCATALYQAGIPEQEIMSRTGHRSIESVRKYKRPSSEMLKDVSNVLESCVPQSKKIKTESATCCTDMSLTIPIRAEQESDDKSLRVPVEAEPKSDGVVPNGTFYNCTFNVVK